MGIINTIKHIIAEDVIKKLTKGFREELISAIEKLERKAKGTKNPYDDMLVALVKEVLLIPDKDDKK